LWHSYNISKGKLMRYSQLAAFEKHVKDASPNHLAPIYFIIGKSNFDCRSALEILLKAIVPNAAQRALVVQNIDAEQLSASALSAELNSQQLFADKRVLHLQGVDKCDKSLTSKLESYFASPNPFLYLILTATTLHRSSNFYKKGEMAGVVLEFAEEKPWEKEKSILPWITAQVSAANKRIAPATAQLLVKWLGPQQSVLYNELQKLICYVGSRNEISPQDIASIATKTTVESNWQLGESLMQRDLATALRIMQSLFAEGTAPIALLRQIRTQFQTSFQVCSILANGGAQSEITELFPYMRGGLLEHHRKLAQSYGIGRFRSAMLKIDETEWLVKSSPQPAEFLVELLLMKLVA
jgi:DNA polymerase-3 subunit delta